MTGSSATGFSTKQSKLPLYASIAIVAGLILCYFLIPGVKDFLDNAWKILTSGDKQRIQEWVNQFGYWGPAAIVLAMLLQMFLLVIPTPLLMVVAVVVYGPFWGSLIILVAVSCASTAGYWIGASLGRPVVTKLLGDKSEKKVEAFIEAYGFWTVIVTRLTPFLSNDAISFVGGMLRMNFWRFMGATLLGITPLIILIAYLGKNYERLKSGLLWGSVISLVLFILYVWWDKRKRKS